MQIWDSCTYGSQKLIPFYGYKEYKLQISPVSLRTVLVLFLDQLLLKKDK